MLSIEAHHVWVTNGKPRYGDIWLNKTKCHTEYKKAIKLFKMRVKEIFTDKSIDKLFLKILLSFGLSGNIKLIVIILPRQI